MGDLSLTGRSQDPGEVGHNGEDHDAIFAVDVRVEDLLQSIAPEQEGAMANDPFEKGEDDGVLTILYWFDDEPADEDELLGRPVRRLRRVRRSHRGSLIRCKGDLAVSATFHPGASQRRVEPHRRHRQRASAPQAAVARATRTAIRAPRLRPGQLHGRDPAGRSGRDSPPPVNVRRMRRSRATRSNR